MSRRIALIDLSAEQRQLLADMLGDSIRAIGRDNTKPVSVEKGELISLPDREPHWVKKAFVKAREVEYVSRCTAKFPNALADEHDEARVYYRDETGEYYHCGACNVRWKV